MNKFLSKYLANIIDQKEKVLDLISSLRINPAESVRIGLNLKTIANEVKKNKNPKLLKENNTENSNQPSNKEGKDRVYYFFASPSP